MRSRTSGASPAWLWPWRAPGIGAEIQKIEEIPAVTFCEDCKKEYPTVQYGKICPYCGSPNTYLVRGNEMIIKEIEVPQEK